MTLVVYFSSVLVTLRLLLINESPTGQSFTVYFQSIFFSKVICLRNTSYPLCLYLSVFFVDIISLVLNAMVIVNRAYGQWMARGVGELL